MPELPEVETVRRGLIPVMAGQAIRHALLRRTDFRHPAPADLAERITGTQVLSIGRRAKYLHFDLSGGQTMLLHLGMSGRILIAGAATAHFHHPAPLKHDHLVVTMDSGTTITFNDARRFGSLDIFPTASLATHPPLAALGPEPLGNGFDAGVLEAAFSGKRTPVKSALLDQTVVAGLGNIYVCEALWRAGINPQQPATDVKPLDLLVRVIREVLEEAITAGGSSLRDHRQTNGELGYFQHSFSVYDREAEACKTTGCTGTITRITQSGRSTWYCPVCQA